MRTLQKKTLTLVIALVLLLTLTLAACSGGSSDPVTTDPSNEGTEPVEPEEPKVVVFAQNADPASIDPHRVSGDHGANVFRNVVEPLTEYNEKWELEPALAKSWEQTGELEWTFYLEEGVEFSNGVKFTADAVVWNLDRGASKEFPRQAMDYIEYYDHSEVVDDYTVKVYTVRPCSRLLEYMADMYILEPGYSEQIGEEAISRDIVGTGPYIFESWVSNQQITLQANENYWKGVPEIDTYIIKTIPEEATMIAELMNGNVDVLANISFEYKDMFEGNEDIQTFKKLERRVLYNAFNTLSWSPNPELQDARVRQAMNFAIDRDAIIENVMGGYGKKLGSFWREDFAGYDASLESYYTYNPEKAKELLTDAGYADGFSITLQSHLGSTSKQHEISQAVAAYLGDVGITCEVETVEYNTMRSIIINGQNQELATGMFTWSWAGKPGQTDSWMTGIIKSDGMSSYNAIEGYDELCDEILAIDTEADRIPLYEELQKKLVEDPPYMYLFQMESIYGVSSRVNWVPAEHMYTLAYDMGVTE